MLVTLKMCVTVAVSAAVVTGAVGYYVGGSKDKRKAVKKVVVMTGMNKDQVKNIYDTMHSHFSETLGEVVKDFMNKPPTSPAPTGGES